MIDKCWLVGRRATVRVLVQDGVVTEAAPLVRRFTGQPLVNLLGWFDRTFGPFELEHDILQVSENKTQSAVVRKGGD